MKHLVSMTPSQLRDALDPDHHTSIAHVGSGEIQRLTACDRAQLAIMVAGNAADDVWWYAPLDPLTLGEAVSLLEQLDCAVEQAGADSELSYRSGSRNSASEPTFTLVYIIGSLGIGVASAALWDFLKSLPKNVAEDLSEPLDRGMAFRFFANEVDRAFPIGSALSESDLQLDERVAPNRWRFVAQQSGYTYTTTVDRSPLGLVAEHLRREKTTAA